MEIHRYLAEKITNDLNKKKIILIYGPRQVGKTTLVKQYVKTPDEAYYNCDQEQTRLSFQSANLEHLSSLVKKYRLIVIDEAQRVKNIGLTLKILIDNFPEKNFIVTGSSSLDLLNKLSEPLTGRFFSHIMHPIAEGELSKIFNPIQVRESLESRLMFGSYPEIITLSDAMDKQRLIENISANYLFKDILDLGAVKNPETLKKLLQSIAFQIGGEVSLSELSGKLEIDKNTVKKYLDICEKLFIIFSVLPYHSNKRKSISKLRKYYFYDLGIRNALINNFNPLAIRNDIGALWENYMIIERMKRNAALDYFPQYYFWRSYQGQEIDLIEESGGERNGFEFKFSNVRLRKTVQEIFTGDLEGKTIKVIHRDNCAEFLS